MSKALAPPEHRRLDAPFRDRLPIGEDVLVAGREGQLKRPSTWPAVLWSRSRSSIMVAAECLRSSLELAPDRDSSLRREVQVRLLGPRTSPGAARRPRASNEARRG